MIEVSTAVLTDEQERAFAAIDMFLVDPSRRVFTLEGLAGTGKTFLLSHVADQYKHAALVTLTGKAASVLRRKYGVEASTIHSFFYRLRDVQKIERGKDVLRFDPIRNAGELRGQLILLDESSMVSEEIGRDMMRSGAKFIVTGDPGQLPPVQGQRFFNQPDFTLREVHRQALQSPIIRQAHAVRRGGTYEADGADFRVSYDGSDADLLNADVVLCWTNRTRDHMNSECRRVRNIWQTLPQPGEPVVCLKNAAEHGIFNGAVYTLQAPFIQGDSKIVLDVDGIVRTIPNVTFVGVSNVLPGHAEITASFDFGYAMTVHKAQGSEWSSVVLIDEYRRAEHRREWLYTAITRAAQQILVVRA